ncbi:MAG: helix-turn-helix transcriptional regulator [Nocardiopsaceae bacterium]|nr:helix-turn-helix transcriptional regulator [Nocardiopsaceae bacterium]
MSSEEPPELRKITDARTLRALAHPVRVALIEELSYRGPMTATEVGERIGETPTTCSFHLRQLAKYGFVEEAGGGKGRARPWRMTSIGMSLSADDPEALLASDAVVRVFRERSFARYQAWLRAKAAYPREWRKATADDDYMSYVTADELKELSDELQALLTRFHDRLEDPSKRPPGAMLVETMLMSYPVDPPPPDEDGGEDG